MMDRFNAGADIALSLGAFLFCVAVVAVAGGLLFAFIERERSEGGCVLIKKENIKWAVLLAFLLFFVWGVYTQTVEAAETRIGISKIFSNDKIEWTGQEILFEHRDWYANIARIGGDETFPDVMRYSAGYRVKWRDEGKLSPFLRLGMAYFDAEPTDLISDLWAYDLAIGCRVFQVVDVEWSHNSTGGRSLQNEGVDMFLIGVVIQFGDH